MVALSLNWLLNNTENIFVANGIGQVSGWCFPWTKIYYQIIAIILTICCDISSSAEGSVEHYQITVSNVFTMCPATSINMESFSLAPAKVTSHGDVTRAWSLVTIGCILIDTSKPCVGSVGIADTNLHTRCYWITDMETFTDDLKCFPKTSARVKILKVVETPAGTEAHITDIFPAANVSSPHTHTLKSQFVSIQQFLPSCVQRQ